MDGTNAILAPSSLLLLLLAHVSAAAQEVDARTRQRVHWFIYEAPTTWFGDTREAITRKLGPPGHLSFTLNPNPQDTTLRDSVFTLQYDSASFDVYAGTASRHEFVVAASVSGSRYLRRSPLPFGTPMRRVRAYFGDSSRAPTPTLVYSCTWCDDPVAGTSVAFWFRAGRLVGLKWQYKID